MARYIYPETTPPVPHLAPYEMTEEESLERMRRRQQLRQREAKPEAVPEEKPRVIREGPTVVEISSAREEYETGQRAFAETYIAPRRTLTEAIYPVSPELAGFVGTYEAWIRPEVPTPSGAVMEHVTVRGYPAYEFMPKYMRVPEEPKHVPYTVPPKDPYRELRKLGPRYVVGGIIGEVSQAYLIYRAGQKLFPPEKKVVTKPTHIVPRKEPYAWLGKEPAKTMLMPLEEAGPPIAYRVVVTPGKVTPIREVSAGAQRLLMGGRQLPEMVVRAVPRVAYVEKELIKQATRGAARLVTKPSVVAKALPFFMVARDLPKAWQREPYPGTRVRVKEEVETVYYGEAKAPTRLAPSKEELTHIVRRGERVMPKPTLKPIVERGMKPMIGTVPEAISRTVRETRQTQQTRQQIRQQQTQMLRQFQVPQYMQIQRAKPIPPFIRPPKLEEARIRKLRQRFARGWFIREYPIRPPSLEMLVGRRRKRRKRR